MGPFKNPVQVLLILFTNEWGFFALQLKAKWRSYESCSQDRQEDFQDSKFKVLTPQAVGAQQLAAMAPSAGVNTRQRGFL